jgi:hypothetical protein
VSGRLRRAAVTAVGLALVAGCGVVRDNAGEPAIAPAVLSVDAAKTVFAHYETVNNAANTHLDPTLMATIEGGSRLVIDQASYRSARATKRKFSAFRYADPVFHVPRQAGYPRWFLVSSRPGKAKDPELQLFVRARAGDPWLMIASPRLTPKKKLPELVTDADGFVQPAPAAAAKAGATAYLDYLNGGPRSRNASRFAADPFTRSNFADLAEEQRHLGSGATATNSATLSDDPIIALRTKDGGTLVLFASVQREEIRLTDPDASLSFGSGPLDGLGLRPGQQYRQFVEITASIEHALVIPPKGPRKMELIGSDFGLTKATGL